MLPFAPFLYTGLACDFDLAPINASQKSLTLLAAGPQLGLRFSPLQRLNLKLAGYGGLYFGLVEEGAVRNPFLAGLVDAGWLLSPSLSLGLGAAYKRYLAPATPLYQGLGIRLGAQYHVGAGDGEVPAAGHPGHPADLPALLQLLRRSARRGGWSSATRSAPRWRT